MADGSVVKFISMGNANTEALALTTNRLDRIGLISRINVGSSTYFYDNTITSNNMLIM